MIVLYENEIKKRYDDNTEAAEMKLLTSVKWCTTLDVKNEDVLYVSYTNIYSDSKLALHFKSKGNEDKYGEHSKDGDEFVTGLSLIQ